MKKRFLPISLLLTIIILAQTSFVVSANGGSGKYTPRTNSQATSQSFMKSIRANQETGLIDPAWLLAAENSQARSNRELKWESLGPDNYGSLTRGIVYDKADATNKTIYIGTMGGGVFKSVNGGITWKTVEENVNLMVSSMVQTEDGTIFIGTGDGRGAHDQNGLADLNYENSFVGRGVFKLGSAEPVDGSADWSFVNDLASHENTVYAATSDGLFRYAENAWTAIVDTIAAYGVEVTPNGTVLAVIGDDVYMVKDDVCELVSNDEEGKLPSGTTYKVIAVSPSDDNYMYVSYLSSANGTGDIYMTSDAGNTWQVAYKVTGMYDIYANRGMLDNAMAVYPNNPRKVLIGGLNLWVMRDEFGEGVFRMECVSDGSGFQIAQSGGAFYYNYSYVHKGIQGIAFNPSNPNEFFVGSEGGIFKGTYGENGYLFEGANRYFETAENHTSVVRMFSVAQSSTDNNVLGGSLDHGTINIYGEQDMNSLTTGSAIYPNDIATTDAAATYGAFDFAKAGGPCAISTINSNVMFVTATGANSETSLLRTESAGFDYDKDNFPFEDKYKLIDKKVKDTIIKVISPSADIITNADAFRTPIVLFENYNDTKAEETVKYYNRSEKDAIPAGTVIQVHSRNCNYPFDYKLTEDLLPKDSIEVKDIISSTFLVAVKNALYMSREALIFNKQSGMWKIASISGTPNALTISSDGDIAYVGTLAGKLYKVSGLSDATSREKAIGTKLVYSDNDTISDEIVSTTSVLTFEELDGTVFNGRAITSIAINPKNSEEVIVTLGNYGNDDYVFSTTDGGATFTSVQANLPKAPVYSSLFEKDGKLVILGTENGIYTSEDMTSWEADANMKNIPVMDIKQQLQVNREEKYVYLIDEVGDTVTTVYPGVYNEGMIYIATFGRGLYKTDAFKVKAADDIQENTLVNTLNVSVYPNPIVNEATINFNVEGDAMVSYQIFDLSGRMVKDVTLGKYPQGSHTANFNVDGLSSGTYIIKVQAGATSNTAKVLVY